MAGGVLFCATWRPGALRYPRNGCAQTKSCRRQVTADKELMFNKNSLSALLHSSLWPFSASEEDCFPSGDSWRWRPSGYSTAQTQWEHHLWQLQLMGSKHCAHRNGHGLKKKWRKAYCSKLYGISLSVVKIFALTPNTETISWSVDEQLRGGLHNSLMQQWFKQLLWTGSCPQLLFSLKYDTTTSKQTFLKLTEMPAPGLSSVKQETPKWLHQLAINFITHIIYDRSYESACPEPWLLAVEQPKRSS